MFILREGIGLNIKDCMTWSMSSIIKHSIEDTTLGMKLIQLDSLKLMNVMSGYLVR